MIFTNFSAYLTKPPIIKSRLHAPPHLKTEATPRVALALKAPAVAVCGCRVEESKQRSTPMMAGAASKVNIMIVMLR